MDAPSASNPAGNPSATPPHDASSSGGDAWRDALIHMDRPGDFATGFGYMLRPPIVRPAGGRARAADDAANTARAPATLRATGDHDARSG